MVISGADEEGYGFKVVNSILDMERPSFSQIYPKNGGFYSKDSTITGSNLRINGMGDLYIESANIIIKYLTQQKENGIATIKNSNIVSSQQISIYGKKEGEKAIFENSEIESGEIYIRYYDLNVENSTVNCSSSVYTGKKELIKQ